MFVADGAAGFDGVFTEFGAGNVCSAFGRGALFDIGIKQVNRIAFGRPQSGDANTDEPELAACGFAGKQSAGSAKNSLGQLGWIRQGHPAGDGLEVG